MAMIVSGIQKHSNRASFGCSHGVSFVLPKHPIPDRGRIVAWGFKIPCSDPKKRWFRRWFLRNVPMSSQKIDCCLDIHVKSSNYIYIYIYLFIYIFIYLYTLLTCAKQFGEVATKPACCWTVPFSLHRPPMKPATSMEISLEQPKDECVSGTETEHIPTT